MVKIILKGLEKIKFDENGSSISDAGSWSCGTDVKINGKWYGIIAVNEPTETKIRVIYSNKKEATLKWQRLSNIRLENEYQV